jgi:ascorbate-specific PTS system EIIC-type component UlaA
MRGQMPFALLGIIFGALETAGGAQELIYLGILQSQTYPLVAGTLGTVAGFLLLAAGVALLVRSPLASILAQATAWVSVPVFLLVGVFTHRAGWPITAVGILFPLLLTFFCWKSQARSAEAATRMT